MFSAGLNFHLTPDKPVDLYIGPMLAFATFSDVGFRVQVDGATASQDFATDDDFAFGAQIGADTSRSATPGWALNVTARYYDIDLGVTDDEGTTTNVGFDPIALSVGFGYRF